MSKKNLVLYLIWLIISLVLVFFFKNIIEDYSLLIIVFLIGKDILWDIWLRKPSNGLEHAPFLLVVITGFLTGVISLNFYVFVLFVADFIIDVSDDFGFIDRIIR
jgi:hypothetical protein